MERAPSLEPIERPQAEVLVADWKAGPTLLASSSEFRRQQLSELDFTSITLAAPIPDEIETEVADAFREIGSTEPTYDDTHGYNLSEQIAVAKVRHVLGNEHPSPETLVLGFDTTSTVFAVNQASVSPQNAEKYESITEARGKLLERFEFVAHGALVRKQKLAELEQQYRKLNFTEEEMETALHVSGVGLRHGTIAVQTGIALAAPHMHDTITHTTDETRLFSQAIAECATESIALERLVEAIITTQGEAKTLQLSGGIDFADSYVRDILKLHEIKPPELPRAPEALYRGMASQGLEWLLISSAQKYLDTK